VAAVLCLTLSAGAMPLSAETLTFNEVLRRVVESDASLEVAKLRVERAREEIARAEGQLAWMLSGQGGVGRDLSLFGIPTEKADAAIGADKRLSFGPRIGVTGSYTREDSDATISPLLPNPANNIRADVFWRQPLARGVNNADYQQGRNIAEAGVESAGADRVATFDSVARRTADVYFTAAYTHARLANAVQAVERAERFREYVRNNLRLGIAEEKDRLQAEAQLAARRAERDAVQLIWTQQRTTLNRLLEHAWDAEHRPLLPPEPSSLPEAAMIQQAAAQHSPEIIRLEAQRRLAESVIARNRDAARDQLDAVLSVGSRQYSGDTPIGSVDTSQTAGSLRLEYRGTLGHSVQDAELNQAFLDRTIVQRQLASAHTDLEYRVHGLRAELDGALQACDQARRRVVAERAKVDEATRRYRRGRSNTAELIQFENDARAAELLADQQTVELARRLAELDVLRGDLWVEIGQPHAGQVRP